MRRLFHIFAACAAAILQGCTAVGSDHEAFKPDILTLPRARSISADLVPHVKRAFAPGATTFVVQATGPARVLAEVLEADLRQSGFAVASAVDEPGALPLRCEVDALADADLRITLSGGDTFDVTRLYEQTDDGAVEPVSPVVRRLGPASTPNRRRSRVLSRLLGGPAPSSSVARSVKAGTPSAASSGAVPLPVLGAPPPEAAVASPPVGTAAGDEPVEVPPAPPGNSMNASDTVVLSPNSDGVIEISAALLSLSDSGTRNPFVQEYRPKTLPHQLSVAVSGIALGPNPTVILNDHVYSLGEAVDGFEVVAISPAVVQLRRENFVLNVPMQEGGVVIRYP